MADTIGGRYLVWVNTKDLPKSNSALLLCLPCRLMITLTNKTVLCRFKDGCCDDWGDSEDVDHEDDTDVWDGNSDSSSVVELSVSEDDVINTLAAELSSKCRLTGKLTTSCC